MIHITEPIHCELFYFRLDFWLLGFHYFLYTVLLYFHFIFVLFWFLSKKEKDWRKHAPLIIFFCELRQKNTGTFKVQSVIKPSYFEVKARICSAFRTVHGGVSFLTNQNITFVNHPVKAILAKTTQSQHFLYTINKLNINCQDEQFVWSSDWCGTFDIN